MWSHWDLIESDFQSHYGIHLSLKWLRRTSARRFRILVIGLQFENTRLRRALEAGNG